MGKSRNRSRRDARDISNRRLPTSIDSNYTPSPARFDSLNFLREIEDRREWHPEGPRRPARSTNRSRHRLTEHKTITRRESPIRDPMSGLREFPATSETFRIGFEEPKQVAVCVRRKQREEVLHAFKKTGKVGQKRPKRSWYSNISCKGKK